MPASNKSTNLKPARGGAPAREGGTTNPAPEQRRVAFVLASASAARAATLRAAGIDPIILTADIDEEAELEVARFQAANEKRTLSPSEQVGVLAAAKARKVKEYGVTGRKIEPSHPKQLVGCDSMLEFEGEMLGKPHDPEVAFRRIKDLQSKDATLWTGHHAILLQPDPLNTNRPWRTAGELTQASSTTVHFGAMTDEEITAYVATGEPLEVAGAFTIDGFGGAFLRGVTGDPHSVVGISLPLLREIANELGVFWPSLWKKPA